MAKIDKIQDRMTNNPQGWRIEDVERIASKHNIEVRRPGGSHVIFFHPDHLENISIPDHGKIKQVYIKKFLALVEKVTQ